MVSETPVVFLCCSAAWNVPPPFQGPAWGLFLGAPPASTALASPSVSLNLNSPLSGTVMIIVINSSVFPVGLGAPWGQGCLWFTFGSPEMLLRPTQHWPLEDVPGVEGTCTCVRFNSLTKGTLLPAPGRRLSWRTPFWCLCLHPLVTPRLACLQRYHAGEEAGRSWCPGPSPWVLKLSVGSLCAGHSHSVSFSLLYAQGSWLG